MRDEILRSIAEEYPTPAYVFQIDELKKRVGMIKNHIGERVKICYAMKANPFLIKPLIDMIDCYEVCSPGEFRICERNEIPMEQIVLSGVYKEYKDMLHAIKTYGGAGIFTIESMEQLHLLEKCAKQSEVTVHVILRVTSGNQFGMEEEEICGVIEKREEYTRLDFVGLQQYTGTQKKKMSKIREELAHLDEFIGLLQKRYGYEVSELEYGPGLYVPYFTTDAEVDDGTMLDELSDMLGELTYQGSITLEMGRYISAYCGYYLTRIVDKKMNCGQNYCIVDGGINHLSYFGQAMAMKIPYYRFLGEEQERTGNEKYHICGSLCTVNDVIVKNLSLPDAQIGDILVFERVGAYSVTEGIYLFLSRDLPGIMFWSEETGVQMLRGNRPTDVINSKY